MLTYPEHLYELKLSRTEAVYGLSPFHARCSAHQKSASEKVKISLNIARRVYKAFPVLQHPQF